MINKPLSRRSVLGAALAAAASPGLSLAQDNRAIAGPPR
jgi:hypothetical protein